MEVGGERVHDDHLLRPRADEAGTVLLHHLVDGHPGPVRAKMALHPVLRPLVQLLQHVLAHPARLQAQRVAAEVHAPRTCLPPPRVLPRFREQKLVPHPRQLVLRVHQLRKRLADHFEPGFAGPGREALQRVRVSHLLRRAAIGAPRARAPRGTGSGGGSPCPVAPRGRWLHLWGLEASGRNDNCANAIILPSADVGAPTPGPGAPPGAGGFAPHRQLPVRRARVGPRLPG